MNTLYKLLILFVLLLLGGCVSEVSYKKVNKLDKVGSFNVVIQPEKDKYNLLLEPFFNKIISNFEEIGFYQNENNPRYTIYMSFTENTNAQKIIKHNTYYSKWTTSSNTYSYDTDYTTLNLSLSIFDNDIKSNVLDYVGDIKVEGKPTSEDYLCLIDALFSKDIWNNKISLNTLQYQAFNKAENYYCTSNNTKPHHKSRSHKSIRNTNHLNSKN